MTRTLRPFIPWLITTLISIILLLSSSSPQSEMLRSRFSDLIAFFASPVTNLVRIGKVWQENKVLNRELVQSAIEIERLREAQLENIRLRKMLGFEIDTAITLIPAEVAGLNPEPGLVSYLINRGKNNGVEGNDPVITRQGVVGRVYRSGSNSAIIQLLTDPNIGIAGRIQRNREQGIVHSTSRNMLRLDGVPISTDVRKGDNIITSGLGGVFPEGLSVGVVQEAIPSENQWLWDIYIQPAVNFNSIEEVFIIKRTEH